MMIIIIFIFITVSIVISLECVHVTDTDSFNQRQNILHDKWNNHDIKVFTDKYVNNYLFRLGLT